MFSKVFWQKNINKTFSCTQCVKRRYREQWAVTDKRHFGYVPPHLQDHVVDTCYDWGFFFFLSYEDYLKSGELVKYKY